MKRIVVLTGAGMSAESGLKTFRDTDGLWEEYNISEIATPEAWERNPRKVLEFYDKRRKQSSEAQPNVAHKALVNLEKKYDVRIITQNIDDLHERAGSAKVLHLHGEITKSQSSVDPNLVYPVKGWKLSIGEKCKKGSQLRPHVVWFGEPVPNIMEAAKITETADILIIIGTSLNVYPAAGLIDVAANDVSKYLVDPGHTSAAGIQNLVHIREKAGTGVPELVNKLLRA